MKSPNLDYTGGNINVLKPDMFTKTGFDYEYNTQLPTPGIIKNVPLVVQNNVPIDDNYESVEDFGGLENGFE